MSYPGKTLYAFGCYLVALGLVLLFVPNTLLSVFGLPGTQEVWIRVIGMLLLFLAMYDILAARSDLTQFIRWSVPIRASVVVFFAAFVLLGFVAPVLILFGVIDLASALWTRSALAKQGLAAAVHRAA
jgi:hypothetical protein